MVRYADPIVGTGSAISLVIGYGVSAGLMVGAFLITEHCAMRSFNESQDKSRGSETEVAEEESASSLLVATLPKERKSVETGSNTQPLSSISSIDAVARQEESELTGMLTARGTAGRLQYVFEGTGNPNVYYNKVEDALYFFRKDGGLEGIETLDNIFFIDEKRGEIRDAEGKVGGEETAGEIRARLEEEFERVESEEGLKRVNHWLEGCAVEQIIGRGGSPFFRRG